MSMARMILLFAALSGMVAVASGAFGAHGLKQRLGPELLGVWQTAVLYQLVHTLALLAIGIWLLQRPVAGLAVTAGLFAAGILLFSGSLYGLALGGPRWLGSVTPLGGVCFMLGWAWLVSVVWRLP